MRFLDANVSIYAFYKPRGRLSERAAAMKIASKEIVERINEGEEVVTTLVHISEVNNILKKVLSPSELQSCWIYSP